MAVKMLARPATRKQTHTSEDLFFDGPDGLQARRRRHDNDTCQKCGTHYPAESRPYLRLVAERVRPFEADSISNLRTVCRKSCESYL